MWRGKKKKKKPLRFDLENMLNTAILWRGPWNCAFKWGHFPCFPSRPSHEMLSKRQWDHAACGGAGNNRAFQETVSSNVRVIV